MVMLRFRDGGGFHTLDEDECRAAGRALAEKYRSAEPFPHIVLDELLDPDLLREIARNFPTKATSPVPDRAQERLKFQYHPDRCAGRAIHDVFTALNSQAFLIFLEEMTGIKGLIGDPYYAGAGLHETISGGHLGIHADFNWHDRIGVQRRLNLLVYLNEDWDESYGGALELWDRSMESCQVRVLPEMARAVIFTTNLDSYHGHPDPLRSPPGRSRRSIATYYYQAPERIHYMDRTTTFRVRPDSQDRRDWRIIAHHFANDWCPPILRRRLRV